jgi:hypothetical protein
VSPGWLAAFVTAHLRAHGRTSEALERCRGWLEALRRRLDQGTEHLVPETFDGADPPGPGLPRALGDPLSIPAAAELLRVWVEELEHQPAAVAL